MSTRAADKAPANAPVPEAELFATMALIRAFETRVAELYRDGEIPGFVHTSLGQEGVAAGVGLALREDDYVATTHRGHGHCLARGMDVDAMIAELFARGAGVCHGKGGSMHVADPSRGLLGANAIVGASLPLAVGAALSSKLLGQGRVAVAFFGEGAVNQGAFHEAVNLAAIQSLPALLVCENNVYAEFSDSRLMARVPSVARRAVSYGVEAEVVDGNDADAVARLAAAAAARCREGLGPFLIEAETYRWHGHYEGDAQPYKPEEEATAWRERDPLEVSARRLRERGEASAEGLERVRAEAGERVEAAIERARGLPAPDPEEAYADVYGE
ncbi:MAG TPA: thiamine pyrophosphate-dependent dehydrogenase E1 component subunit alpha [Solirubrobacterales bacterium]|jgi:TPP-dependent pyruvate/acetoin dehydrogenase alpha subunit|nr:thiamine pyrophosphate-dependent dehydrogenase E1 component subunit alpha [Solirubrobacterales bacterium]